MSARLVAALALALACAPVQPAVADVPASGSGAPVDDAEATAARDFQAAQRRAALAAAGDTSGLDALEALGARRPITRWTDNAWAEAARYAERAKDYARARRDLEQVIAVGTDDVLIRRAKANLARLGAATGGGRWDAVAREHERLADRVFDTRGDPREALAGLERLAREHPDYPRIAMVWLAIAQGLEREGEGDRALELLGEVRPPAADRERVGLAFARLAIRRGELADARARLDQIDAAPGADRFAIAEVRAHLETAEWRARARIAMWIVLAVLVGIAAFALRRDTGSWRAAGRRLLRPPVEAVFLLPVGAVLIAVSRTGNPLVARALLGIVLAGIAVAWLSGALLEAHRARHGRIAASRAALHVVLALAAIASATYLSVDRDRMLDLVDQTIEHGPAPR